MKKIKCFAIVMIATLCVGRAANAQTMNNIYQMAAVNDVLGIAKEQNLEITDENGDTAICHAIKNFDTSAYSVLKDAGANTRAECVKKLPEKMRDSFMEKLAAGQGSKKFLGLGKWTWGAIGLGAAGGIVAMSSGGGSGSANGGVANTGSAPSEQEPNQDTPCSGYNYSYAAQCPAGYTLGSSCTSGTTVKYKCDKTTSCPYNTQECVSGYVETGSICVSGDTVYKECAPAECEGFDYRYSSQCPTGYAIGSSCLSGTTKKYKCDALEQCEGYNYTNSAQCPTGWTTGSSCLSGTTVKYKCNTPSKCAYQTTECSAGFHETGNTCQSGNYTYKECEPDACEGYDYTASESCPIGWIKGASCQSGNETKYKCDVKKTCLESAGWFKGSCPDGYLEPKVGSGMCVSGDVIYVKCERNGCEASGLFTSCREGWYETANPTSSSCRLYDITYRVRCSANTCTGYDYTSESQCPDGWTLGSSCKPGDNARVYKCDQGVQCPYTTETCTGGYQYTGNTCKSGNVLYKECEKIQCGANATWSETGCVCDTGYENWIEGTGCSLATLNCGENAIQNGTQCQCNDGYENWTEGRGCSLIPLDCGAHATQNGRQCECDYGYRNWTEDAGCSLIPLECGANAMQNGTQCQCNTGYQNWVADVGCSLIPLECGANAMQNGTQCQCNTGYQNWVADIGCSLIPLECGENAVQNGPACQCVPGYEKWVSGVGCSEIVDCGAHAHKNGVICECEPGYDNWTSDIGCLVSGIGNTESNNNRYINNSEDGDITGAKTNSQSLYIKTRANGNVTGIASSASLSFNQVLSIDKVGNGDVFGFYGTYSMYNAGNPRNYDNENGYNGIIAINNVGNGNIYGIWGTYRYGAQNAYGIGTNGVINIHNSSNTEGDVYGIYLTPSANHYNNHANALLERSSVSSNSMSGIIFIDNSGDGNIYGLANLDANVYLYNSSITDDKIRGTIDIRNTNINNNSVYGMYTEAKSEPFGNLILKDGTYNTIDAHSLIKIENMSNGDIYGIYSKQGGLVNVGIIDSSVSGIAKAEINITNYGNGNTYGLRLGNSETNYAVNSDTGGSKISDTGMGIINIKNKGNGDAYGMFAYNVVNRKNGRGIINIANYSGGSIYGLYGSGGKVMNNYSSDNSELAEINLQNFAAGNAVGMYANGGTVTNSGIININNIGAGDAIGIFGDDGAQITNSGTINITRDSFTDSDGITYNPTGTAGKVFGIYAKSGSSVNNSGTINITSNGDAYGIYAESGSTVTNTGTISLNGVSCSGADCDTGNYIALNGATLYNSGIMSASQMNLNSMGGDVVAGIGSRFVIDNDFSGNLNISSEWVQGGNQTTYIAENMIEAGNISGLNVRSASAMFDASIADNGHDVIMQMKDFDSMTDNKSLAAFLASNYAKGNGNDLFNALKSIGAMTAFNGALSGLTGMNAFTQFAYEDLSAMREISFSMNNKLFENSGRDNFDVSDNMAYFSFSNSRNGGSGQYGISSAKIGENLKLGYGMAMANINTGDDSGMHRQNKLWLFYMPATYTADGYELVVAPKAGFAHSEYNRRGYNNINYDGQIEKRILGLMNDLRYPLSVGNWTVAPDLAFNTIVYAQSGHEDAQAFGLIIPDDRTVSVETGLGFYTKYEKNLTDGGRLKLNSGLMAYREFGNAYDIKLGIRGLDGTFSLYNNDYEYRGAASLGFDYVSGRLHLYGDAQYFMDNNRYMNFKGGFAFRF